MRPSPFRSTCFVKTVTLTTLVSASLIPAAHAQTKFGFVNLGASKTATVTVNIAIGGTLSDILVLTGGGLNKDYTLAKGGTCAVGASYSDNSSCTVNVSFAPKFPGLREGGVNLEFSSPTNLPAAYMQGTGFGPKTSFFPGTIHDLGEVPRLSALAADDNGTVFYTGEPSSSGSPGAPPAQLGVYGSFPPLKVGVPAEDENFGNLVVDGAGNLCVYQALGGFSNFQGSGGYYLYDPAEGCPAANPASKVVTDAARNFYTLPGPVKHIPQPDRSFVQIQVANLDATSLAVDRDGNVFVAGDMLYKETLQPNGTYVQTVVDQFGSVSTVDIDGVGSLYVTSPSGLSRASLQPDGTYRGTYIDIGTLPLASTSIGSVDLLGNVYLTTQTDIPFPYNFYDTVSSIDFSNPPTLTFDTTTLYHGSSDSPQIVTITNSGNTPLTFSGITYPLDFWDLTGSSTCTPTTTLAAGSECSLFIDFYPATLSPTTPAQLSEQVVITTNTLNHPATQQAITVTGTETIPPYVGISPQGINFGSAPVGSTSAAQLITIQNTGISPVTLGTMSFKGANTKSFLESGKTCKSFIAVGASCTVSIEFKPAVTGNLSASFCIGDNAQDFAQCVPLIGTGN